MTGGYLFGAATVLLFWVISGVVTGRSEPWALAITESRVKGERQDELSASKLQTLLWTLVTLFSYGSVFGALLIEHWSEGALPTLPPIPVNLLVLMGMSVTTAASAKGVTVSYKARGRIPKRSGGVTTNPRGDPDLVKTQMLVWTFIGTAYYLLKVVTLMNGGLKGLTTTLPDVDGAFLVLMGSSQGAYIGDKLVSRQVTKKPELEEIKPNEGSVGTELTLVGDNFGAEQGQSFVDIDGIPIREGLVWGNYQISRAFIPTTYDVGDEVPIKVYRDGEPSDETLIFRVA